MSGAIDILARREAAEAKHGKIRTSFDYPPIPVRCCDWSAVTDNYEPGHPMGQGATEQEAVADLLDKLEDMEECP